MKVAKIRTACVLIAAAVAAPFVGSQEPASKSPQRAIHTAALMGPVRSDRFHTTFIRLGSNSLDGLLYEPDFPGSRARIALLYAYPTPNFDFTPAPEMASRGYRTILIRHYGEDLSPLAGIAEISKGIAYLRTLPGVQRVVIIGHSGGSRLVTFYADLAEHGPAACQRPELLYPCQIEDVPALSKADGVVLLDPAIGASNTASSFDPAYEADGKRKPDLDMYSPANGYDPKTGSAHYSAAFIKRFYAAQSARNMEYINQALTRLKVIEQGKGEFTDDEPFLIPGAVTGGSAVRLFHTDLSLQSRTKNPHMLLRADGSAPIQIIHSVRPATGLQDSRALGSMAKGGAIYTTVRTFLANYAIRTGADFAFTADDIVGVDWTSSNKAAPASAEGVTVPALVLTMTCNTLMVPGEVLYDHLASKDKTYAAVEGAIHTFTPCRPEYGDTVRRTFDFVDHWLSESGRF
jgi:pimeloyl-ACP methyl ester carboxylesterase